MIIGNYCQTPWGWQRFRTLRWMTQRWWEICTVRLAGGPLSQAERDQWLKAGKS